MFNMIKMDLARMFKSKSMFVIGIIFAAMIFSTSFLLKTISEDEKMSQLMEQSQEAASDNTDVGISVSIVPEEDGKVSVLNDLYGNTNGKVMILFMVIFTVIYSSADYTSGFIKNIAGQVKNRGMLVVSKAVCLFIYTVIFFAFYLLVQIISDGVILGYFKIGDVGDLFSYLGVELLLHYAIVILVMSLTIIIRNNLISMIVSVCMCMNLFTLMYNGIDKIISKAGIDDFSILKYTLTGNVSLLLPGAEAGDNVRCIVMSLIFGLAFLIIGSIVFKKRDVV